MADFGCHAATVTAFAELGVMAWEERRLPDALAELSVRLPDALAELSVRLDLAGAGPLLDQLMATCWGPDRDDCPHCRMRGAK